MQTPPIRRAATVALTVLALALSVLPAHSAGFPPQVARGVTVPAGFAARVFGNVPAGMLPTSLTWGPSTGTSVRAAGEAFHGVRLYVTVAVASMAEQGDFPVAVDRGAVVAFEDEGVAAVTVADGLRQPLGIVMGPDETLYVSETADNRGKVTALIDADADGFFETHETVIHNLPNGRHQTNGLAFGPDGMLYVANGNATDDGLECGPAIVPGGSEDDCPAQEVLPWSGSILRVDPSWRDVDLMADIRMDDDGVMAADGMDDDSVLVARGFRNIYDVAFDPLRPDVLWTPMNGPDNPSGSEPLYAIDTTNMTTVGTAPQGGPALGPVIEDAGFPSCLYDPHINNFPLPSIDSHEHEGVLEPQETPNQAVVEAFGPCDPNAVHRPEWIFQEGHEGTTGIAFTQGGNFPERYRNDLFVGEWGSIWNLNGGEVTGHKIVHLELDADRRVVDEREFMTNVLPMDMTFNAAGLMYVADMTGQIYEVRHVTDLVTPDVVTVDMVNGQFVPAVVTIVQGQTVRWVNTDPTPHTVTAVQKVRVVDPRGANPALQDGREMNSPGPVPPGGAHTFTFRGPAATYTYNSTSSGTESNTMRGTIVVLPMER